MYLYLYHISSLMLWSLWSSLPYCFSHIGFILMVSIFFCIPYTLLCPQSWCIYIYPFTLHYFSYSLMVCKYALPYLFFFLIHVMILGCIMVSIYSFNWTIFFPYLKVSWFVSPCLAKVVTMAMVSNSALNIYKIILPSIGKNFNLHFLGGKLLCFKLVHASSLKKSEPKSQGKLSLS